MVFRRAVRLPFRAPVAVARPVVLARGRRRHDRPLRPAWRRLRRGRRQPRHLSAAVGLSLFLRARDAARSDRGGNLGALVGEVSGIPLLSLLIIIPLLAGVLCLFVKADAARWIALVGTLIDLALSIYLWAQYNPDGPQWQFVVGH